MEVRVSLRLAGLPGERPGRRRRRTRVHKDAPYTPQTKRQVELAEGEKRKMVNILSHTAGACRGLPELDVPMILSVCTAEEVKEWCKTSLLAAGQLRTFVSKLRRANNGKKAKQI